MSTSGGSTTEEAHGASRVMSPPQQALSAHQSQQQLQSVLSPGTPPSSRGNNNNNSDFCPTTAASQDSLGGTTRGSSPGDSHSESDDRLFSLKWNEFEKQLTAGFSDLYYSQDFTDVTLSCEGKSAHAHKLVLAMCSPYFREIFKENPCQHPVVIIKGIRFQDLQKILRFIYFGQVSIVKHKIQDFIEAAELIKLDGITAKNVTRRDSRDEVKLRSSGNIPSGSSSPADVSNSSPSVSTTTGNLRYPSHPFLPSGMSSVFKDYCQVSPDGQPPKVRMEGGVVTERNSGRSYDTASPPSQTTSPLSEGRYHPHGNSTNCGGMAGMSPTDMSRLHPIPMLSHKKSMLRWTSGEYPREVSDSHHCPRSSPMDHPALYTSRQLGGEGSMPVRVPSASSSYGDGDHLLSDQPLPLKVGMDDGNQESSRESVITGGCSSGEYELSIRSTESPYPHIKSFTTPSGMVVTSTLHGLGDPSASPGGPPWPLSPVGLKSCTSTSGTIPGVGKVALTSNFRLPLAPSHGYPNGAALPKAVGLSPLDVHSAQSSVPAKKRFSQVSNRLLGYTEQQMNQEKLERQHRMQLGKPGAPIPFAQLSPGTKMVPALTNSQSGLAPVPRLKSHRQSHVPPSARYTTAEVDALVDSVNDHSGPYVPCKICDKLVKRERLRAHIHECHLVHGEKIICPHCGVGLKSKGSYRVHVWRHRRGVLAKGIKSKWVLSQRPRVTTP